VPDAEYWRGAENGDDHDAVLERAECLLDAILVLGHLVHDRVLLGQVRRREGDTRQLSRRVRGGDVEQRDVEAAVRVGAVDAKRQDTVAARLQVVHEARYRQLAALARRRGVRQNRSRTADRFAGAWRR
jgi:hypothetical protein